MINNLTTLACESMSSFYFKINNAMEREIGTRFWINDKLYEIVEQKSKKK